MKRNLILSIILANILFMGCSCKKPTDVIPPDNYDPRNVSRNSTISANSFITVDGNGTVHIIWRDVINGIEQILYSFKAIGQSWVSPINISNSTVNASAPQIAVDPAGGLHAVWDELGTSIQPVMYTTNNYGGNWYTPVDISSSTQPGGALPQVGIDIGGNVYVVYERGGGYGVP